MILSLPDFEATRKFGVALGGSLSAGTVILLQGDLGAGKTTLVQGIAEGLGISESVESPTFTLINEYFAGRVPLYHLDLYRLEPEEAEALHLESYWDGLEMDLGIVAIEWAERLPYKPDNYLQIYLSYCDNGRQIELIGDRPLLDGSLQG
ncbi:MULTISPECIES: tRNA (adenosine(37)-N6)-threonylcarbamoyltransferase complex ATPase subunit type 1 TsaE [unclassified Microcoleus]|uniref:tRNA (adenosine(37)-N6)-threonylcarbamoyltransferase complex ATPase subunit type 1 TsaE n=1 Tax=unclassified Microcoleus TaxID=2642155 RepID=UPI002FD3B994